MVSDRLEGLTAACHSSWNCVTAAAISAYRWIYTNILCSQCICDEQTSQNRVKSASPKPRTRSNESTPLSSPPNKIFKGQQSPDRLSKEIADPPVALSPPKTTMKSAQPATQQSQQPDATISVANQPTNADKATPTTKTTSEKQNETVISTSKRVDDQTITRTAKQTSVATSHETSSLPGSKDLSYKSQASESPKPRPSPPKIDFVETGSIFGDRKRHTQQNLLLMDNGRFKSPGRPNVLPGPGGRTIRISFQTGFPSIKSIESRAPPASVKSKMSNRSDDSVAHDAKETSSLSEINPDVPKKAFAKKKRKKRRRSIMSRKSMKSVISKGPIPDMDEEKDIIRETPTDENIEEQLVKSVESQGNSPN